MIKLRREAHIALEISLKRLPGKPTAPYNGVKIPATAAVKNYGDTTGKSLLELRIDVYGATTKQSYQTVCTSCEKREGKKIGPPSLINFKAESDIIVPKDGKIRVEFVFGCYPKDHRLGDTDYL